MKSESSVPVKVKVMLLSAVVVLRYPSYFGTVPPSKVPFSKVKPFAFASISSLKLEKYTPNLSWISPRRLYIRIKVGLTRISILLIKKAKIKPLLFLHKPSTQTRSSSDTPEVIFVIVYAKVRTNVIPLDNYYNPN